MDKELKTGISLQLEKIVEDKDTAKNYNSGNLAVFATPAMIALMENTCYSSVEPYLEQGFSTVGIKVDISHIKASPVGSKITCESELIEIDRKRLVYKVSAKDEEGEIGSGLHERVIINIDKFMNKS